MDRKSRFVFIMIILVVAFLHGTAFFLHSTNWFPTYYEIGINMYSGEIIKGPYSGLSIDQALLLIVSGHSRVTPNTNGTG